MPHPSLATGHSSPRSSAGEEIEREDWECDHCHGGAQGPAKLPASRLARTVPRRLFDEKHQRIPRPWLSALNADARSPLRSGAEPMSGIA